MTFRSPLRTALLAALLACPVPLGTAAAQLGTRPGVSGTSGGTIAPLGTAPVGMNLGPIEVGFARSSIPFADVMKLSDPFYEVLNQNDPSTPATSPSLRFNYDPATGYPVNGVPKTQGANSYYIATKTLANYTDNTGLVRYKPGVYHVTFSGTGALEFYGDVITPNPAPSTTLLNGDTMYTIDTGAGGSSGIVVKITSSAPAPNHLHDIRIVHTSHLGSLGQPTQTFNPDWLPLLKRLTPECLRFTRWKHITFSDVDAFTDEVGRDYQTWATDRTQGGVPYVVLIELCREVGADLWVQIPHKAGLTTAYAQALGALLQTELSKPENAAMSVYVEYTNEMWKDNSTVWTWGENNKVVGEPLGGFYGRIVESQMSTITWPSAAGGLFAEGRLFRVLGGRASQAIWIGDAIQAMRWYPSVAGGGVPPPPPFFKMPFRKRAAPFDVVGINAYVGSGMFNALDWNTVRDWAQANPPNMPALMQFLHDSIDDLQDKTSGFDIDLQSFIQRHKLMLTTLGIPEFNDKIIGYESGQALEFMSSDCDDHYNALGLGPCPGPTCPCTANGELTAVSNLFNSANLDPSMVGVYRHLIAMWNQELPGNLINMFNFVQKYGPIQQGSWGVFEWVYPQITNPWLTPKFRAIHGIGSK